MAKRKQVEDELPKEPVITSIFVANLARGVGCDDLEGLFEPFGEVDADIWVNRDGRSVRFAVVQMEAAEHRAERAIRKLNGKKFFGKRLWVERAPDSFGRLGTVCNEAAKEHDFNFPPTNYRPIRVDV